MLLLGHTHCRISLQITHLITETQHSFVNSECWLENGQTTPVAVKNEDK